MEQMKRMFFMGKKDKGERGVGKVLVLIGINLGCRGVKWVYSVMVFVEIALFCGGILVSV